MNLKKKLCALFLMGSFVLNCFSVNSTVINFNMNPYELLNESDEMVRSTEDWFSCFFQNLKNSKEKIAIIITGWSKYFSSDKYFYENPYLSDELTELIIEKNFKGIAIDTCSVDKYGKDTNHKKLLENNVWIVENITNCDNLNKTSYSSFFIPLNIEAEASPVRAFLKKD